MARPVLSADAVDPAFIKKYLSRRDYKYPLREPTKAEWKILRATRKETR